MGLYKEEEQIEWLKNKAEKSGFQLLKLVIAPEGLKEDKNSQTKHLSTRFEGILKITNKEKFIETLKNGIGSAKAFGFGLLSIAPYRG